MEVLELIEDLEAMGEEGERWFCKLFPFLWGKTVVDAAELFEMLNRLRSSLPDEMTTANQVARDREKIVREAHEERAKILEAAREQAQLLISNDELVRQSERRALEIYEQAQVDADAIRAEAETWARGVVERLENYVTRTQATLEKAKKALAAPTAAPPAASSSGRGEPRVMHRPDAD
jgi:cell division septum initiation protein DivIVA